jgi:hypothetical protein
MLKSCNQSKLYACAADRLAFLVYHIIDNHETNIHQNETCRNLDNIFLLQTLGCNLLYVIAKDVLSNSVSHFSTTENGISK